ncbi:MAG TPA: hypothetical protein VN776_16330 [Terracidiphilus sp.]|nr:hypothetical protein [Terracidiphilus sp.]
MILTLPLPALRAGAALFLAVSGFICVGSGLAAQSAEAPPKVASQPLTAEQLAVYRATLVSWYEGQKAAVNLGVLTDPIAAQGDSVDKTCLKGLRLEAVAAGQVHRIRPEDLAQLGPFEFHLVDSAAGQKEVSDNDPGKAIQKGKSVDEAVDNGFAHGLLTLSEIQFDRSHTHALVSFSFVCGRLCGNGTTMLLEKKDGVWKKKGQCGGWVS